MQAILLIAVAFCGFGFLVAVHEFGHFIAAKRCGVGVYSFSVGMGPVLLRRIWRGTEYRLSLLPLGGYCGMINGDEATAMPNKVFERLKLEKPLFAKMIKQPELFYQNKSAGAKAAILVGGPLANIIAAFLVLALSYSLWGVREIQAPLVVESVRVDSIAETNGVIPGMTLTTVNENEVNDVLSAHAELGRFVSSGYADNLGFRFGDGASMCVASVTPAQVHGTVNLEQLLGVKFVSKRIDCNVFEAVGYAAERTVGLTLGIAGGMAQMFTGNCSPKAVSGPAGLLNVLSKGAMEGAATLFGVVALLNVAVALFNLLPVPPLDGGRLLFVFLRSMFGDQIIGRVERITVGAGAVLMLVVFIYATRQDLISFFFS